MLWKDNVRLNRYRDKRYNKIPYAILNNINIMSDRIKNNKLEIARKISNIII